jgi:hypothetical protein
MIYKATATAPVIAALKVGEATGVGKFTLSWNDKVPDNIQGLTIDQLLALPKYKVTITARATINGKSTGTFNPVNNTNNLYTIKLSKAADSTGADMVSKDFTGTVVTADTTNTNAYNIVIPSTTVISNVRFTPLFLTFSQTATETNIVTVNQNGAQVFCDIVLETSPGTSKMIWIVAGAILLILLIILIIYLVMRSKKAKVGT